MIIEENLDIGIRIPIDVSFEYEDGKYDILTIKIFSAHLSVDVIQKIVEALENRRKQRQGEWHDYRWREK